MQKIARERVERVARLYATSKDASRALGIAPGSFSRLCRLYNIESPHTRRHRRPTRQHMPANTTDSS